MPAFGGLLLLVQIACAVRVVRTGRPYYWIYIVVFVPVVGMAAYLIAEFLPDLMGSRTARYAASGVGRAIDPGRGLREALRRAQMTPTIENKAALAEEYLCAGQPGNAAALYRETLTGIHATDPTMMLGLARALFAPGDFSATERSCGSCATPTPITIRRTGISSSPGASRSKARASWRCGNMQRWSTTIRGKRPAAVTRSCCSAPVAVMRHAVFSRKSANRSNMVPGTNAAPNANGTTSPSGPSLEPSGLTPGPICQIRAVVIQEIIPGCLLQPVLPLP